MQITCVLLSWAGFLGSTAYFACPQGGLKGLLITLCTLLSGVGWAQLIIHSSAMLPQLTIAGYAITGVVAFLMCMQAKNVLLSFVPGTFIGACATFAGQGDWRLVLPTPAHIIIIRTRVVRPSDDISAAPHFSLRQGFANPTARDRYRH
ncbi:MAG: rane protein [Enterobacter kobei]|nr:rane protein [Enterobacter kobei]